MHISRCPDSIRQIKPVAVPARQFLYGTQFFRQFCVPLYMLIIYTVLTRGWLWVTATSAKGADLTTD